MTLTVSPSTSTALDAAARRLVETRDAYWARKLPNGVMRGPAWELSRLRNEMFSAQRAYREAREAREAREQAAGA